MKLKILAFLSLFVVEAHSQGLVSGIIENAIEDIESGDYATAKLSLDQVLAGDSNNVEARYWRAKLFHEWNQPESAIEDLDILINRIPYFSHIFFERGLVNITLENWESAIIDFSKVIELDPQNGASYLQRGYCYYSIGQLDKSENDLSVSIKYNPELPHGYNIRGYIRLDLEDDENAILDFTKSLELDSTFYDSYYGRGLANYNLGNDDKACKDFHIAANNGIHDANDFLKECK